MPRVVALFAILFLGCPFTGQCLNVVIKNLNTSHPDSEVYFSFKTAPVSGTINGQAIVQDKAYSLADIGSGINLQSFAGGRLYFSLGAPLQGTGDPEPINSSVVNWGTRFDKMELTYSQTDRSGVADLTSIDYFAIPLAIKTYAATTATGTPLETLTYQEPANTITAYLAALSGNDPTVLLHDGQGNFLRVLGPTLAHSGADPTFDPYIAAVKAAGQSTRITGLYSHLPDSVAQTTQNYDFTATYNAGGSLVLDGGGASYAGGATVGPGHEIVIQAADLALGIYSANPDYTVDGAAAHIGDNDVYSAVVRDILTGYALGFVNSATVDPLTGTAFKDEASNNWWTSTQAFGYLQPDATYYDEYAAYLQTISSAYGYPFSDRWQVVQASLDPDTVGTMELDVLPDVGSGFAAWQAANFTAAELKKPAVSGPQGDATGAGVTNLVKYVLGIPPKQPGVAGLPASSIQNVGGSNYLFLTYPYNPLTTDAVVTVQVSGDLQTWNSGTAHTTEVSRTTNSNGTQTVVTRGNTPVTGSARQFMRLSVTLP